MKDFKKTATVDLVHRLNNIEIEKQKLDIEWNLIIQELWYRIPTLSNSVDIQPKPIQKKIGGLGDGTKNNSSN